MAQFLYFCICALLLGCAFGFQSNPRSPSVIPFSRLSSTTTSDAASTTEESSIPSKNEVDFKAYGNGYKTVFSEVPFAECKASSGSIPSDLEGSYFRTGPGKKTYNDPCRSRWIWIWIWICFATHHHFLFQLCVFSITLT